MEQTLPLLIGLLVPLGLFAMIAWVVYVMVEGGRRRHLQTTEFHARILERMGSAREFGEFLGTEAGSRFLNAVSPQQQPVARIVRFVQFGIVAVAVGLGLLAAGGWTSTGESEDGFWLGVILTGSGVGMLLSAAISYRLLPHLDLAGQRKSLPDVSA